MNMSDYVANYILELLEADNGSAEIQRNELAGNIGCVPSQINYVITSRFTPEQGYIVESQRGGGGYIRITRIKMNKSSAIMHIVNSIGDSLTSAEARIMLSNMSQRGMVSGEAAKLVSTATSERSFLALPKEYRDKLRASIFKNMLITAAEAANKG